MPPPLAEANHVVSSAPAAGLLLAAGAQRKRIRGFEDWTMGGACVADPLDREELLRSCDADGWHNRSSLELLRAAVADDAPVVLWATRAYSELVWLWWALEGFRRIGVEGERLFLARPRPRNPQDTIGDSPAELRIALEAAKPVTADEWREACDLWSKFASPSPLAFDEARRTGSSVFPELTSSAELHGVWFPRLFDGRLEMSEVDEDLLGALDDSWCTMQDILERLTPERLDRVARCFHGFFSIDRLCAWGSLGALEHEELDDDNPWEEDRFRATARTRVLLEHGLDNVADAPQLYVGGCLVNDPASPWVRIEDDAGWRIVLQRRP